MRSRPPSPAGRRTALERGLTLSSRGVYTAFLRQRFCGLKRQKHSLPGPFHWAPPDLRPERVCPPTAHPVCPLGSPQPSDAGSPPYGGHCPGHSGSPWAPGTLCFYSHRLEWFRAQPRTPTSPGPAGGHLHGPARSSTHGGPQGRAHRAAGPVLLPGFSVTVCLPPPRRGGRCSPGVGAAFPRSQQPSSSRTKTASCDPRLGLPRPRAVYVLPHPSPPAPRTADA